MVSLGLVGLQEKELRNLPWPCLSEKGQGWAPGGAAPFTRLLSPCQGCSQGTEFLGTALSGAFRAPALSQPRDKMDLPFPSLQN